jgi:amidase
MPPSSILQESATSLLSRLQRRELSAVELVETCCALIAQRDGELGALTDFDPEPAIAAARSVDSARGRTEELGPLAGLPLTIKSSIDAVGFRSTHGRLSDARMPVRDAPAVRRLRAAGGIVLGKTNVPIFLNDYQSSNPDFGVTRNPWDPTRTAGGSSGGSGAAVAAGFATADLGSDLAGSLRIPAAWCGLFGHKPSTGIVSKTGHLPWPDQGVLEPMISAVGPITRSAADLRLFFDQLVGVEGPAAVGWRIALPPPRVTGIRGIRIGVWLDDEACPADRETRDAISGFADRLASTGARVESLSKPPGSGEPGAELFRRLQASEVVHGFDDESWESNLAIADSEAGPTGAFARRVTQSFRAGMAALESQARITQAWADEVFTRFDVVLCPAVSRPATVLEELPLEQRRVAVDDAFIPGDDLFNWSRLANLPKLPGTVVPLGPGPASGLPVGAQLLGPYLEDLTPLQLAIDCEAAELIRYIPAPSWARS